MPAYFFQKQMISITINRIIKFLGVILLAYLAQACAKDVKDPAELLDRERALVRSTIDDSDRAERFVELLDERDQLISEQAEILQRYRQELQALNLDYQAERQSVNRLVAEFREQTTETASQYLSQITALKALTTAEEWKIIAAYQLDNLQHINQIRHLSQGGS